MESISFSTGQIFGYWPSWKEDSTMSLDVFNNYQLEITNGHSKSDLFIKPMHSTLKEEVFESGFINIKQWLLHLKKANEYKETHKVKQMKNAAMGYPRYGIKYQTVIPLSTILSVILYC